MNEKQAYPMAEYQLVLNPHESLRQKIVQVRQEFAEQFQSNTALYSKPFLTLVRFTQYELVEQRLLNRLRLSVMGLAPIKVELSGFGHFPTHSIYIQVTSKLPIQHLVKTIRTDAQRLMKGSDDHKPHFLQEPHFIVGRKLLPWQYEKGWQLYQHKSFTGRFVADAVLLLKRQQGQQAWQIVERLPLAFLPVQTVQGALFA